jgi:DNA-directed RNA polymerase subunit H (RpoH/RPB5)
VEKTLSSGDTLFIIILKDKISDSHMMELNHLWERYGIFVVIQGLKGLQFNILDHTMVPNHRIIRGKELEDMLDKYNISDISKLPEISRYDPVAQVIGMFPGDVCEITRPSKSSVNSLYYRICTNTSN